MKTKEEKQEALKAKEVEAGRKADAEQTERVAAAHEDADAAPAKPKEALDYPFAYQGGRDAYYNGIAENQAPYAEGHELKAWKKGRKDAERADKSMALKE